MGILLMILGLASAGFVADFAFENHLTSAPVESFTILGSSFNVSVPALVLGAFVAGALTLILLKSGMTLMRQRRTRRRALKRRLVDLERENATLRTKPEDGSQPEMGASDTLPADWIASPAAKR
ncbi:MAG: lipopolysaccharide assembly protein LapA domain-containing protein [Actinomycetota bacterium]